MDRSYLNTYDGRGHLTASTMTGGDEGETDPYLARDESFTWDGDDLIGTDAETSPYVRWTC